MRLELALATTLLFTLVAGSPLAAFNPPKAVPKAPRKQALAAPVQVTSVEGITEYRLANGLRVLLFPDPSKPNVTVNITYLVGSRMESYGETGMAHLLEHMIFKGTPRHPDIPKELTEHGTRPNGTTSYDRTNYFEAMQATDENLKWALDLEADRMVNSHVAINPELAAEKLKTEMTVVRNEYESGENHPASVLMQRLFSTAYQWHNYGKVTIGCRADIENVDIHHLSAFFKKYYQPDNAVLLVAGKFDPAKTLGLVNAAFGPIPRPTRVLEKTYTLEPAQDGEHSVTVRRAGDIQFVMAGYHVPAGSHPDFPAVAVLAQILGDSPSGRLYKGLVDGKKAVAAGAMPFSLAEPGMLLSYAVVRKDGNLEDARETLLKLLEDPAIMTFTPAELERAKTQLLTRVDMALNQTDQVGLELSEAIALGDWRLFFLERDRVKAVTAADVARVATAYLQVSNRSLGVFIPTDKPMRAEIPLAGDVAAMVKDYQGQALKSEGEAFDTAPAAIDARTQRFTTPAGLKVALLAKQTRGGSVHAALSLHFGDAQSLTGKAPLGDLTADMLERGTLGHTRQELADAFDQLKAKVQISGSEEGVHVDLETIRENLPRVLELVVEMLKAPAFPAAEFETLRQENLAGLESSRSEPQALGSLAYRRHQSAWPKGHPRYVPSLDESLAEYKAVTVAGAKAFYQAFYGAGHGELALVGAFDPQEVQALVNRLLGAWQSPAGYTRIPSVFNPAKPEGLALETPDKANAFFIAGLNLPIQDTDPDHPAMVLGNFMLGGGFLNSRLATRIRVKEGLSYGVGSQYHASAKDEVGQWSAFAIYAPQNAGKLEAAFREELDKVRASGFTPEELKAAKAGWLQAQQMSRAQDPELASRMAGALSDDRTMAFQADLEQKVLALTPEQVQAALVKFLDPAKLTIVKAGDFAKASGKN